MNIQRGFRDKLDKYLDPNSPIEVTMQITGGAVYDYSCFGVDSKDKLSDDRYMVFYNQTASPDGEVQYDERSGGAGFRLSLGQLPESICKLVFTASIDGSGTMGAITSHTLTISQNGEAKLTLSLTGADFAQEKAIISVELYRKDCWRIAAVAAGFNGGLGDLLRAYGGEEAGAPEPPAPAPAAPKVSLEKKLEAEAPKLVCLAKPLKVQLEKHRLTETTAKVALVMDITGSMRTRYRNGTVQEIVNKTLPLAVQFDDDGELDCWYYATTCRRMPGVNLKNYEQAVPKDWYGLMTELGGCNNEPVVMEEVYNEYRNSSVPAYVIFITDGGFSSKTAIKELMIQSSSAPIFWQFVGVGGKDYGLLENLDHMQGRLVDNANFFAMDDFMAVSSDELYDRLLGEFPQWLTAAREKAIIK